MSIKRKDEPQVRAIPMERSQSMLENFIFGSVDLWIFTNAHFGQPSRAAALVYWYAGRLNGSWSFTQRDPTPACFGGRG